MNDVIQVHRDDNATVLLRDSAFRESWRSLYGRCPWATVHQDFPFVNTWYEIYRSVHEPLLVLGLGVCGELTGLLTLARDRRSGALVIAGIPHGEYCVWLALPETGDSFIQAALDSLQREFPKGRLTFRFLPPNTPLGWLRAYAGGKWNRLSDLRPTPRPLMAIGDGNRIRESLRKKSNKKHLKRLERLGKLEFQSVRTFADIEHDITDVIDFCDLRQGGVNNSLPFRNDPYKLPFYTALFDVPGLLHTTVWRLDGRIISAHIGIRDRGQVVLGIITHSPFLAEDSPGRMHIYLLGLQLSDEGIHELDLTPEGSYKDRFATHYDESYRLTVFFSVTDRLWQKMMQAALQVAKRALRPISVSPDQARAMLSLLRHQLRMLRITRDPVGVIRSLHSLMRGTRERIVYRREVGAVDVPLDTPPIRRDNLSDLLTYQPLRSHHPPKTGFLRNALMRLERGDHVYTYAESGLLIHHGWLRAIPEASDDYGEGTRWQIPSGSLVFDEFDTHPDYLGLRLPRASVVRMLQEAAATSGVNQVFAIVAPDDTPSRQALEELGFRNETSLVERVRPYKGSTASRSRSEVDPVSRDERQALIT